MNWKFIPNTDRMYRYFEGTWLVQSRYNGRWGVGEWKDKKWTKRRYIEMCIRVKGKAVTISQHQLVYCYYTGYINWGQNSGFHVHHINNNKHDNRIENLKLVTAAENSRLAYEDGFLTVPNNTGENNGSCKIPDYKIENIFIMYHQYGLTKKSIAEFYRVSDVLIGKIINAKHRKYITEKLKEKYSNN